MIHYGYITGWAAAVVLMCVLPLMVTFISYLCTINHQLADIKRILLLVFPAEAHQSKQDYSGNSYLRRLFPWRGNRPTSKDDLEQDEL